MIGVQAWLAYERAKREAERNRDTGKAWDSYLRHVRLALKLEGRV